MKGFRKVVVVETRLRAPAPLAGLEEAEDLESTDVAVRDPSPSFELAQVVRTAVANWAWAPRRREGLPVLGNTEIGPVPHAVASLCACGKAFRNLVGQIVLAFINDKACGPASIGHTPLNPDSRAEVSHYPVGASDSNGRFSSLFHCQLCE